MIESYLLSYLLLFNVALAPTHSSPNDPPPANALTTIDSERRIPALSEIMALDKLPLTSMKERYPCDSKVYDDIFNWKVKSPADRYRKGGEPASAGHSNQLPLGLLDTYKDPGGTLWGLLNSPILGKRDLWLIQYDGTHWTNPLFTGDQADAECLEEWKAKYIGNKKLTLDGDGDGWTDLVEMRIGSDAQNRDTDGDGIQDSEDRNPLAAPRPWNDTDQILVAAVGTLQSHAREKVLHIVVLPDGVKSLEFMLGNWVVLVKKAIERLPLWIGNPDEVGYVSFSAPWYDFNNHENPNHDSAKAWLWNKEHSEVKLAIALSYGPLAGSGFDIRLKMIDGKWVVVEQTPTWAS